NSEQVDIRAQLAEYPDARKPARGDFHRVSVDHLHAADRQQAHAGHRNQHECDHGNDLGADGKCGHGWLSQALETGAAELLNGYYESSMRREYSATLRTKVRSVG